MQPKILITSLGSIGQRHLKNTLKLIPEAKIAVLRSKDAEIPPGVSHLFTSLQDAVNFNPEIVIIASPANLHVEYARAFINKAKGIFIEKPIATHEGELEDFVHECKKSSTFVMVGYILRFLPALRALKSALLNKKIGEIYHAHIQVGQYLPDWRKGQDYRVGVSAQQKLGGGPLLELSHELDYTSWLFGSPDSIYCRSVKSSELDLDVDDNVHLIYEYDSAPKKTVMIQLDFLQRVPQMTFQAVGEHGTLVADLIKEDIYIKKSGVPNTVKLEFQPSSDGNEPNIKQFDFLFSKSLNNY